MQPYKKLLEKQGYRFTGEHSAVKICEWTRRSLAGKGVCYKQKFYGINSHRCLQLSVTTNYCDFDCVFCWREKYNEPFRKIDEPKQIIKNALEGQRELLSGFGGFKGIDKQKFAEANSPRHFAISLTGETLYYPKLNQLIKELHKQHYTTFIVTNGSQPKILEKLEPPTQLYVSVDAPNAVLFRKICKPINKNAWRNFLQSLAVLKKLKRATRTTLRITLIKGLNMVKPEQYAKLIKTAEPDFVEVKAYMFVGASRKKLALQNMPLHWEVRDFAEQISEHCDYRIADEQPVSRVVLMMNGKSKERIMKI